MQSKIIWVGQSLWELSFVLLLQILTLVSRVMSLTHAKNIMIRNALILVRFSFAIQMLGCLAENNLSGQIPDELGNLINLKVLDVCECICFEFIWYLLSALWVYQHCKKHLIATFLFYPWIIDNNSFTGPIPTTIGNLRYLEKFNSCKYIKNMLLS